MKTLIMLLMLCFNVNAFAFEEPKGLCDIKFGMSKAEALRVLRMTPSPGWESCPTDTGDSIGCEGWPLVDNDLLTDLYLDFVDNKIARITVLFRTERFGPVRELFVARYGKPTSTAVVNHQNRMGAKIRGERLSWNG